MAGDWMMIDLELADKPEVHQIAAALQLDPDAVVGKLIKVWAWFDKQTVDGNARSVTETLVDRLASHNGFAGAMSEAGWLDTSKSGIRMPSFERWNGKSAKKRALASRRVQRWRNEEGNASSVTKSLPEKRREKNTTPLPPSGAFLRFWSCWPKHHRKQAQGKCLEVWRKTNLDLVAGQVLEHVESLKRGAWLKDSGEYIPAPLVYLNQRRWEGAETAVQPRELKLAI